MDNKGGCDMAFSSDDMMDVASQCGKHVMETKDEAHRPLHEMMATAKKEDQATWFAWFQGLWNNKMDN